MTRFSKYRGKKVALLALARNCEQSLPRLFSLLAHLSSLGLSVSCYIGENDSTDGSRRIIAAKSALDPSVVLVETGQMREIPNRFARMAKGREMVREAWMGHGSECDYVCVIDVDTVLPNDPTCIDLLGAIDTLSTNDQIAAISACSYPYYYDLLALRMQGLFNFDISPSLKFGSQDPLFHYLVHARMIYPMQRKVTALLPLKTDSSFNGMCLYRAEDYASVSYCRNPLLDECEHVDLCRQLCIDGRYILAGQWFKLNTPPEHGPKGILGFIRQRLGKGLWR